MSSTRSGDVAGTQVDNPNERRPCPNGRPAKCEVVRHHNASLAHGGFQDFRVGPTSQPFVPDRAHIVPARSQAAHDIGSDVLVCEKRELEWLHAVIRRSHVRSPLSAFAA